MIPPKGILLHGDSGTGKTVILDALSNTVQQFVTVIQTSAAELISSVVGESERNIVRLFNKARQSMPSVIVLEQIQFLTPCRDSNNLESEHNTYDRVLSTFLIELDGILSKTKLKDQSITILATANKLTDIDPALLRSGRFDLKVECQLPSATDRSSVWHELLSRKPVAFTKFADLDTLVEHCTENSSGWSIAKIETYINETSLRYLRTLNDEGRNLAIPDKFFF